MTALRQAIKYVWLTLFILCLAAGIHQTWRQGFSKSYVFFVCAIFAFGFYWIRRNYGKTEPKD